MRFEIVNASQRSPEWFQARAGRLTGSRAGEAFTFRKDKQESAARRDYRLQLAIERLTGLSLDDDFTSKEMRRGIELEPAAIAAYEARTGAIVRRTGFLRCLDFPAGHSLDCDVPARKGFIEAKCPKSATHVSYLTADALPEEYREQVRHGLWVTGYEWCDFISYDDRLPLELQLFVKRVFARDLDIPGYEAQALAFLAEVGTETAKLEALRHPQPKAEPVEAPKPIKTTKRKTKAAEARAAA